MLEYFQILRYLKNSILNTILFRKQKFLYDDGGRASSNIKGTLDKDCVTRVISLSLGLDYKKVYNELYFMQKKHFKEDNIEFGVEIGNSTSGLKSNYRCPKPKEGVSQYIYEKYLKTKGLEFTGYNHNIGIKDLDLRKESYIILTRSENSGHTFFLDKGVVKDLYPYTKNSQPLVGYIKL